MNLLLDTHVAIWSVTDRAKIPTDILAMIADKGNEVFVSAISILEIAIKHSLGRGDLPPFGGADAIGYFKAAGFRLLEVSAESAAAVERLPPIHADPFDRVLVAQAKTVPLKLVTHDQTVVAYGGDAISWS